MRTVNDLRNSFNIGVHGCGFYAGTQHSNTLEGFKYWQRKGIKIIEVDISITSDGKHVALAHKMMPTYLKRLEIYDFEDKNAYTHDWFMNQKLFRYSTKGLHPLDLKTIVDELSADEDLIVMFDLYCLWSEDDAYNFTQELMSYIGNRSNIRQRILIEAYCQNMIQGIRNASDTEIPIIYCVRDDTAGGHHQYFSPTELKRKGIVFLSYPYHYTERYPGEITQFASDSSFVLLSYCKDRRRVNDCKNLGGAKIVLVDFFAQKTDFIIQYPLYIVGRVKNRLIQSVISRLKK